ncbi:hypothetical protein GCM10025865_13760 [Paraoerskovia sediminicola]|uniref:DUF2993 domain-containing protein n=2 Tax=Paraoerskovia sediminicola TaxID=1138587 RepID=A0ABM8G232_9CELL|nr:hypothetical protein GCM10025865_13760 [Paraoerskovia sediminicola]
MPLVLDLGPAPRPTDGPALAERLHRALITAASDVEGLEGVEGIRVTALLEGPDVSRLRLDLTGVRVPLPPDDGTTGGHSVGADPTTPVSRAVVTDAAREPGTVGRLEITANPIDLMGVPVVADIEGHQLRYAWLDDSAGQVLVELVEPDDSSPVTGHARLSAARDDVVAAVRHAATDALRGLGLELAALDVELTQPARRSVSVVASAKIRKGLLGATARLTGTATIDDSMVATLHDLSVTSGNPLVAAVLATVRGRVQRYDGRRIDLSTQLPPGMHLTDVQVTVGDQIVLAARLG